METGPSASPPSQGTELAPDGTLTSDLWLDREDAPEEITRRRDRGELTDEEAANLEGFWREGFFVFRLDVDESLFDALDRDVDRLWETQPPWVAYSYQSLLTRFSGRDEGKRLPASRIADLHEFSTAALELYLHPRLFRYVELILGEPALATQTLYFQWGSQQALHRDPIHVRMTPPTHLVAAWIALEDIRPGCGELRYVPGSHRLPYYEFEPGRYTFDHGKDGDEQVLAGQQWDLERCQEQGLAPVPLRCRRGECLIWHHSLLHGGSYPEDRDLTRKSLVVHYTSLANMPATRNTYLDPYAVPGPGEPDPPTRIYGSDGMHVLRGCHGFTSPLVERLPEEARAWQRRTEEAEGLARRLGRDLEANRSELERARGELEQKGTDLAASRLRLDESRREIETMKASKFWKLRNAWWRLRRSLRLGG